MQGSVVITGASAGLGLATAERVAAEGFHTVLGCRSRDRGTVAMDLIRSRVPDASLQLVVLDLASLDSVRLAATEIAAIQPALFSLVCNAGIQIVDGVEQSDDGYERTSRPTTSAIFC